MPSLSFRPALVPALASAAGFALLLTLGFWQLSRHHETQDLMTLAQARLAAPPIALAEALADPEANAWRRVRARGTYRLDDTVLVLARRPNASGSLVVSPLVVEDIPRQDGAPVAILVDRGWISFRDEEKALAERGDRGPLDVIGSLVPARARGRGGDAPSQAAAPEKHRRWLKFDVPGLEAQIGRPVAPVVLKRGDVDDGDYPEGEWAVPRPRVNHLEYAWTWFLTAAILAGVFLSASLKRAPPPPPSAPPSPAAP
ncbi:MAG: SURF1 family protein [Deltaproteobacteria bacterium]|nr:SURF1 family protein [Deltaproteobacteria bacterium]